MCIVHSIHVVRYYDFYRLYMCYCYCYFYHCYHDCVCAIRRFVTHFLGTQIQAQPGSAYSWAHRGDTAQLTTLAPLDLSAAEHIPQDIVQVLKHDAYVLCIS